MSDDFNACAELLIKSTEKNIIFEIGENIGRNFGQSKMKVLKNIFNSLLTIFKMKAELKINKINQIYMKLLNLFLYLVNNLKIFFLVRENIAMILPLI